MEHSIGNCEEIEKIDKIKRKNAFENVTKHHKKEKKYMKSESLTIIFSEEYRAILNESTG